MPRSIVKIGRLTLTESNFRTIADSPAASTPRTIEITGMETSPDNYSVPQSGKLQNDIDGLNGTIVPVSFQSKIHLNGYYKIQQTKNTIDWWQEGASTQEWAITLEMIGYPNDVDLESRLSGALTRLNDFTATGERWHAPPIGHVGYFTGSSQPSSITRSGSDGSITVYRAVPTNIFPRWGCSVSNYLLGRVKFLDDAGQERVGLSFNASPTSWQLDNSLVNVILSSSGGVFNVNGKTWDVRINGVSVGVNPIGCSVIRNDFECVIVRLTWNVTPSGRTQIDLTLRRGSRFVEMYLTYPYSATLGIFRTTAESAATVGTTGAIRANVNDGSGNRYFLGTLKSMTIDLANGGLSKSNVVALDAAIGAEVGGSVAQAGDAAASLYAQYVGACSERIIGYKR